MTSSLKIKFLSCLRKHYLCKGNKKISIHSASPAYKFPFIQKYPCYLELVSMCDMSYVFHFSIYFLNTQLSQGLDYPSPSMVPLTGTAGFYRKCICLAFVPALLGDVLLRQPTIICYSFIIIFCICYETFLYVSA